MARVISSLLPGISGAVGKQFVFKQYKGKTIVTKYPDMTNIKPSERQKERQKVFKEAVAYAKAVNRDPEKKAFYQTKLKPGETVYRYALKEYLKINQEHK